MEWESANQKQCSIVHCGLYCALPCHKFTLRLQKVINPLSKIFFPQNKYHLKEDYFYYTRNPMYSFKHSYGCDNFLSTTTCRI